jgi:hypothetical protein
MGEAQHERESALITSKQGDGVREPDSWPMFGLATNQCIGGRKRWSREM